MLSLRVSPGLFSSSSSSDQECAWRSCSQEALRTSPVYHSPKTKSASNLRESRDKQTSPKTQIVASPLLTPEPQKTSADEESNKILGKRFRKICDSDAALRVSSMTSRIRNFPEATQYHAKLRNRYGDVLPTSLDLVSLNHPTNGETAYINASRFEKMVLTQAPFINEEMQVDTLGDFWVLADQECDHLVCLTDHQGLKDGKLVEKTFPYWEPALAGIVPDESQKEIVYRKNVGPPGKEFKLEVRLVEAPVVAVKANAAGECVTQRIFEITVGEKTKRITQWHFEGWNDHSVCDAVQLALLIKLLLEKQGALMLHCSAGLGRTGVVAICRLLIERYLKTEQIPTDDDIDKEVIELRTRRPGSVQNREQLDLISKTIDAFIRLN